MKTTYKALKLFLFLFCSLLLCSCDLSRHSNSVNTLPILSQDELIRPYTKLGRIQVTREVFGSDSSPTSDITAWGLAAIQQEAGKMGADAVIMPEVTGHTTVTGIIPTTEYRATGFAIKFK